MGGSSGSGMSGREKDLMNQQKAMLGQQAAMANQMGAMANSQDVNQLAGQEWTQNEIMQSRQIGQGRDYAMQTATNTAREQAAARGLFSSAGAIGQEAAALGQFDIQQGQQMADLYGNAQQRQFQGLGLKQGLLSGAAGQYGQVGQGYSGMFNQAYGARQTAMQQQQAQQQQGFGMLKSAAGFALAPFTGGASLALGGM